jgi:hypothetical protein
MINFKANEIHLLHGFYIAVFGPIRLRREEISTE